MFEHACKRGLEGIVSKHRYREAVENILRIMETARSRAGVELLIERPLECGARLSEMTLRSATNQPTGLIDLGKVECADRQFWASFSELEQARTGTTRREWLNLKFNMGYAASYSLGYAILALLVVNLLGLSLVTLRAVFRWIAGYKPAP
jgi:hypothetical protein